MQIMQKKAFDSAMLQAQGIKVLDDPKKLKKKLKQKENKKKKSQKEWFWTLDTQIKLSVLNFFLLVCRAARVKEQEHDKNTRQKTRTTNMKARKDKNLERLKKSKGVSTK